MKLKKLLGIISVVIIIVFSMMLTTSYAWYAFDNASTAFEGMTNNDDIIVSYQKGEYINVSNAVPITSDQVDMYSEKNNFNIIVKNSVKDNEILVSISLVEISIDRALQNANFKVELYHQSTKIADIAGNGIGTSGATTKKLTDVVLDNDIINDFELRVYILDNDADQSSMENKTFQAKIQVDVVSRLKTSLNDYKDPDIYISSVTIDGESSNYIPTSGYYNMSATCSKGSNLTWEPLSKTITYNSGSYVNDSCSLAFTSSTDYPLLSEMPVGSYVKYVGNNGCDGKHCEGENANYKNDKNMGYCYSSNYKYHVNGWRIGYIDDGNVHLISAGAPECVATIISNKSNSARTQNISGSYYYGSGYKFNDKTGVYTLTGVTSSALSWSGNYENIISKTPYTCMKSSSTDTCNTLYEMTYYTSSTEGEAYEYYNYEIKYGTPLHMSNLNNAALKYCNKDYVNNGECTISNVWAMDENDFERITKSPLNANSCYLKSNDLLCGWTNDLIDIGGYYWYSMFMLIDSSVLRWNPYNRYVGSQSMTSDAYGLRPVIKLDSSVVVIGGAGTYKDPFIIV